MTPRRGIMSVLVLVFLLISPSQGAEQLKVVSPSSAAAQFPNGVVPEVPALFGTPPYGRTITGRLYYYNKNADQDGCYEMDKATDPDWPASGTPGMPAPPLILLLDRGDCTFVTKVRNAQIAGAQAVVIVDNVAESEEPYMADDGTGSDIVIPAVLVSKGDGDKLKNSLRSTVVTVAITWNIPNPDAVVEWTLWTSSNDPQSMDFKKVFGDAVIALNTSAVFTPHYVILNGSQYNCYNTGLCGSQCINNGLYCTGDPDNNINRGVSGAQVIQENLRQICVFRTVNQTREYHKWWDYVSKFQEKCALEDDLWTEACSNSVLDLVRIDRNMVKNCVDGSKTSGDKNTLLDAEVKALGADGIFYLPTVIINSVQYRGSLHCAQPLDVVHCGVLEAICSGYAPDTQPCACDSTSGCGLCEYRDACGICGGKGQLDACGACLPNTSTAFNKSCAGCDGVPNSGKVLDVCGVCGGTGSYDKCFRCLQANHPDRVDNGPGFDPCGVCIDQTKYPQLWGKSCAGCDGVPNSGKVQDACGVCGGTGSYDACLRCLPAGDPNRIDSNQGGFDACGICMKRTDPRWNKACMGCDGVPNSGKVWDQCGVCGGSGSLDACRRCLNATDPTRIDNGGYDECGACLPTGDPRRVEKGQGGKDACGLCMRFNDPRFNVTCAGCDGVPNSYVERDACGLCNGTTTAAADCNKQKGLKRGGAVAVTVFSTLAAGAIAYCCMNYQQKKMRNDIDAQIRKYQRMAGSRAEGMLTSSPAMAVPIADRSAPTSEEFEVSSLADDPSGRGGGRL
eukprot:g70476.t1